MLIEELSRDFPFVYRNLRCLFEGWKDILQKRQSDPGDLLIGGDIKIRLEGYLNVPEELEEHFYEPFWTYDIACLDSEKIEFSHYSDVDNLIRNMERYVEKFLSSAKVLKSLCPALGNSLYLETDLKVLFQYTEMNPQIPDGLSNAIIDYSLHPHWRISQAEAHKLEVLNQMLHIDQGWMLEEMYELEQMEKTFVQDDLSDDVEWYGINLSYRFQPGTRRNLVVCVDHMTEETNQADFNTIPEYVPGAWARQRHSWIFHDLYDHHGLSLAEVCRIAGWSFSLVRGYSFSTVIHR